MNVNWNALWEGVKQFAAKSVTIAASAVISQYGEEIIAIVNGAPMPNLFVQGLLMLAGYSIWTQVIVPAVNGFFGQQPVTSAGMMGRKSYFEFG